MFHSILVDNNSSLSLHMTLVKAILALVTVVHMNRANDGCTTLYCTWTHQFCVWICTLTCSLLGSEGPVIKCLYILTSQPLIVWLLQKTISSYLATSCIIAQYCTNKKTWGVVTCTHTNDMLIRCKWYSWAEMANIHKIVLPYLSAPEYWPWGCGQCCP